MLLRELRTWYLRSVSSTTLCGIEPYAFARSSHSTAKFSWFSLAARISCDTTPVCSIQPGFPATPSFCTDEWMYSFIMRNLERRLDRMLKYIFPSVFSCDIIQNWSISFDFSSFGIHTPSACLHWFATLPLLQIVRNTSHNNFRMPGHPL